MPVRLPLLRDTDRANRLCRPPIRAAAILHWRLLLLLALLLLPSSPVKADIQEPGIRPKNKGAKEQRQDIPANAVGQSTSIDQGETITLVLHSLGQFGKTAEFLIRTRPEHGVLEGPRQLTRNSAAVVYSHRAGEGPGEDQFTYSVHANGTPVSAPVAVHITIRDLPPAVVASPSELDFGAVKVGDTSGANLELVNTGGGLALGRLEVPVPWAVDGPADYRLGRGERQSFHIVFAPKFGRSFSESLPLLADGGSAPHLAGTGLGPPEEVPTARPATLPTMVNRPETLPVGALPAAIAAADPDSVAERAGPRGRPGQSSRGAAGSRANGALDSGADTRAAVARGDAAALAPDAPVPAADSSSATSDNLSAPMFDNSGYISLVDTGIKQIALRRASRTSLDISWLPAKPMPKSYRVELRHLSLDSDSQLQIDWRPYAQVDIAPGKDLCTAQVYGLPAGTRQTVRVIAVDFSGRLVAGSATLTASTLAPSTFWDITPLRILVALALVCIGLAWRKRWEDNRILRGIDEDRAAAAAAAAAAEQSSQSTTNFLHRS